MEHYLTGYKQFLQNISMSTHTVKQYVLDAKHFVTYWQEHEQEEFPNVQALYRDHLQQKYAVASVNRKLAGTRKFVHFLYDRAYISAFNDAIFEPIEQATPTLKYLSKQQIVAINRILQTLIDNAADEEETFLAYRHNAMFQLFITTGIKPYEAIQMQWQHIEGQMLTVLQQGSYRKIELVPEMVNIFKQLKVVNDRVFDEQSHIWLGLGNQRGEPITEKTIERFFAMLSSYSGFKVTATICRYTYIYQKDDTTNFEQLGYRRKDIMTERLKNLK